MKEKYLSQVLSYLKVDKRNKKRVREDLMVTLDAVDDLFTYQDYIDQFGTPEAMAQDFMENLDLPEEYYGVTIGLSRRARPFEFKSERTLFGLPLVHINIGGRYGFSTAKGIIAIGDLAVGVISLGGISLGIVSIGGISAGVLALAGIGAGFLSVAGISFGIISIGGIAVGIVKAFGAITKLLAMASLV